MNIYESIAAIVGERASVKKDGMNEKQNYRFRGIDSVMNVFNPLLAKHKVFIVPTVLDMAREERTNRQGNAMIYTVLTVQYTFYAEDGSNVIAVTIGEGMDTGDKSVNKAMSAAYKYALFQTFCVPTEDMVDSEVDSPEVMPKEEDPDEVRTRKSMEALAAVDRERERAREQENEQVLCEECGNPITEYKGANGRTVSVKRHVEATRKRFGQALCLECAQKR